MKNCEHEINPTDEEWIAEDKVIITLRCDRCNKKFRGTCKGDV